MLIKTNHDFIYAISNNNLNIFNVKTKQHFTLSGHTNTVTCATLSTDGKYALTGSQDTTARLWTLTTGKSGILSGHTKPISDVYLSSNSKQAITSSLDGTVCIWDITQPQHLCIATLEHDSLSIKKLCVSHKNNLLIVAAENNSIFIMLNSF